MVNDVSGNLRHAVEAVLDGADADGYCLPSLPQETQREALRCVLSAPYHSEARCIRSPEFVEEETVDLIMQTLLGKLDSG